MTALVSCTVLANINDVALVVSEHKIYFWNATFFTGVVKASEVSDDHNHDDHYNHRKSVTKRKCMSRCNFK